MPAACRSLSSCCRAASRNLARRRSLPLGGGHRLATDWVATSLSLLGRADKVIEWYMSPEMARSVTLLLYRNLIAL